MPLHPEGYFSKSCLLQDNREQVVLCVILRRTWWEVDFQILRWSFPSWLIDLKHWGLGRRGASGGEGACAVNMIAWTWSLKATLGRELNFRSYPLIPALVLYIACLCLYSQDIHIHKWIIKLREIRCDKWSVIPALVRQRQDDWTFKATLCWVTGQLEPPGQPKLHSKTAKTTTPSKTKTAKFAHLDLFLPPYC